MPFILVLEACQRKNGEKPNILISKSLPVIVINLMCIYLYRHVCVGANVYIFAKNNLLFHEGLSIQDGYQSWSLIAATKSLLLRYQRFINK